MSATIAALQRTRLAAGICGLLGPLLLVVYFATPFFTNWPFQGGTPEQIAAFASSHATLFYVGAWLQTIGTLLSVVFFVAMVTSTRTAAQTSGVMVIVGSAALLALVLVEAGLMVDVPLAATAGNTEAASTSFGLVNGVFTRVFPLVPASVPYLGLGAVILSSPIIDRRFGLAAITLGALFQLAGLAALFSSAGVIAVGALAAIQALWVMAAAIAFART